jgi:GNAT superfamily N-acetyltransferase
MVAEMAGLYGARLDADPRSPSATPADFSAPGGTCLVGYEGDRPVCVGAIKRFAADCAELKRMYVVPGARGRGVARVLLAALEDGARALGYRRVRLDTGAQQPHALALYERAGYRAIGDYNANPFASWWGEREL